MQYLRYLSLLILCLGLSLLVGCTPNEENEEIHTDPPAPESPADPVENTSIQAPTDQGTRSTTAANELDLRYITGDFSSAVVIHPARFLNSEFNRGLEDAGAPILKGMENGLNLSGIDIRTVEQIILLGDDSIADSAGSMIPGFGSPPQQRPQNLKRELPNKEARDAEFDGEPASTNQGASLPLSRRHLQSVAFAQGQTDEFVESHAAEDSHGGHGPEPRAVDTPFKTLIVRFTAPVNVTKFFDQLKLPTEAATELDGLTVRKIALPHMHSVAHFVDERTLIVTPTEHVKRMVETRSADSPLLTELRQADASQDIIVVVDLLPLRETLLALGQLFTREQTPEQKLAIDLISQARMLTITGGLTGESLLSVSLTVESPQILAPVEKAVSVYLTESRRLYHTRKHDTVKEQIPLSEEDRKKLFTVTDQAVDGTTIVIEGNRLTITVPKPNEFDRLPELMKPMMQQAGAMRDLSLKKHNLRQIGLSLMNYHDLFLSFPGAASDHSGEKKGLSWRVHALLFLDERALYEQFHLDEPWDSAHNKSLIPQMPEVFKTPEVTEPGKTAFQVAVGQKMAFNNEKGVPMSGYTDGLSNIVFVVETGPELAEIWTKPGGLTIDESDPLKSLGTPYPYGFLFLMGDTAVITRSVDELSAELINAFFTRNGGEVLQRLSDN